jgi:hypothetical protein
MFTFDYGKRHKVVSLDDLALMAKFYENMYSVNTTDKALEMFYEMYPNAKEVDELYLEFMKLRVKLAAQQTK